MKTILSIFTIAGLCIMTSGLLLPVQALAEANGSNKQVETSSDEEPDCERAMILNDYI